MVRTTQTYRVVRPTRATSFRADSGDGGRRAVAIYTITQIAILNGFDPRAFLRDVLSCIADHPINKFDQLLPWDRNLDNDESQKAA
ncbi:MAG: transposase domain-containing protein [Geminicoccaceae bacterium]